MPETPIPDIVVSRLPIYLRALTRLQQEGQHITSSGELGRRLGISSAQIRKDLSHFGEFGKQGTGYQIEFLIKQLRQILKVDREWSVALVGAGDLGSALARYNGFRNRGFRIELIFDNDPAKIGRELSGYIVQDAALLGTLIPQRGIRLAMIAVPAEAAQSVADELVKAGIKGILSYAPININVPEGVQVQYIDPVVHLQRMTFYC
ncbi:MAG: redox-sensing transcriptional repressor Rex [Anaerolineales bacterium]|nr:redox-sensing transcriptional repressor Rex [Anaerolineales bacterium]